jgi:endonuclease/exonuclease/phosphatase (EEP) superfamily protein YafD
MAEQGLVEVKWKNDNRKRWLGHPLDQAFIRNMVVKNAEVRGEIQSSDHKPLDLQLAYEGE